VAADVVAPLATVIDTPLPGAFDESSPAEPPREPGDEAIWRRAAIGAVLGCALTVVAIAVFARLAGLNTAAALGIGAFAGIWSGVGFGFMMGGTPLLAARPGPAAGTATDHRPVSG